MTLASRLLTVYRMVVIYLLASPTYASQCVETVNYSGYQIVVVSSDTLQDCTTGIVLDPTEYASWLNTSNIWTIPNVETLRDIWMIGFSIPMILWLVTWAYALVINFATTDHK
jgi:hypothetical protein